MKKFLALFTIHWFLFTVVVEGLLTETASAQQVQWTTTTAGGDTVRPVKSTQGLLLPFLKFPDGSIFTTSPEQPLTFTLPLFRSANTIFSRRASASDSGYVIPSDFTSWNTAFSERRQWDGGSANLVPATGRASLGLGSASLKDSLDFAPVLHTHPISDITALQDSLGNKYTKAETNALLAPKQAYADTNTTDATRAWVQSQSYLSGNQSITLSGDVSGSGATSISTTVADNSHNHGIGTLTGMQDSLNARSLTTHTHAITAITAAQDSLDNRVPNFRTLTGGYGIQTIGNLSANRTIEVDTSEVATPYDISLKANTTDLGSMAHTDSAYWHSWIEDSLATHNAGNEALEDSIAQHRMEIDVLEAASGEDNTASNLAGTGVGIWKDKSGVDLRFKRIKAASTKISVTDQTDSVHVDVNEENLTIEISQVTSLQDSLTSKYTKTETDEKFATLEALEDTAAAIRADFPEGGGGGAPTDATYVTTTANGTLSNEVVVSKIQSAFLQLPVQSAKLPTSNPARIDAGENNWRLLFDASTDQSGLWQFVLPPDYGSLDSLDVLFSMVSATSGNVVWSISVMAVTPGDAADMNTDSYATANIDSVTVPGTAGHLGLKTIALGNMDGAVAGDVVKIKVARDADHASDNATGDAEVVGIILRYRRD